MVNSMSIGWHNSTLVGRSKLKRKALAEMLNLKEDEVKCSNCNAAKDNDKVFVNCEFWDSPMGCGEYCSLFLPIGTK